MEQLLNHLNSFFTVSLLNALITALILWIILTIIKKLLISITRRHQKYNQEIIIKIIRIAMNIIFVLGVSYQITALKEIVNTLLTGSGVLALVLGLAAQEAVGNLVSGMMILFFKPFAIGDLIKTNNGLVGTVIDISLRHTILRTNENTQIMVPNNEINKATLENVSMAAVKNDFLILQVAYESNLETAMQIIADEVMHHPDFIDNRTPAEKEAGKPAVIIRCTDFKDSGIELKASICSASNAIGYAMLSDLRIQIKKRFDEANIVMPYPQIVVHPANS